MNDTQELLPPDAVDPPVQPHQVRHDSSTPADDADMLGIISIILPFIGLAIVGIFVAIIAYRRAKAAGRSTKTAKVGVVVNLLSFVFAFFIIFLIFSLIF